MFTILLATYLAVAAIADRPVTLAPPEEEMPYRCDPRPCLRPQPQSAHAYEGTFSVHRQPQMQCRVAPCPRAETIVTLPRGETVAVERMAFAQGTPIALKLGFTPTRRTVRFEGRLWITLKGPVAILAPTKAAYVPTTSGASQSAAQ